MECFPLSFCDVNSIIPLWEMEIPCDANCEKKKSSEEAIVKKQQTMESKGRRDGNLGSKSFNPCSKSSENFPRKSSRQVENVEKFFVVATHQRFFSVGGEESLETSFVTAAVNPSPTCHVAVFLNYVPLTLGKTFPFIALSRLSRT